jgi:hypothetical protein
MPTKICVISFDHWNYDKHIVSELQKIEVESFHIKIGDFKYKNFGERILNTLTKIFLGINPKLKKRQDYILKTLEKKGKQNQILVINPELIDAVYHKKIKTYTDKYIAYLYDSVSRCPVEHLLEGYFDEVYSFDKEDIKKYGFKKTSNYIYNINEVVNEKIKYDYIYIGSIDARLKTLNTLGKLFEKQGKKFVFYALGKKAFVNKLKQLFLNKNRYVIFGSKILNQQKTQLLYQKSNTIIDIVRQNQKGLSFRIFEAMGLQKNIITNNTSIMDYDIYQSGKIHFIDEINSFNQETIPPKYDQNLIKKYSLENWVKQIFNL